jgi:uncharacterized CHY-type Zn-finger protein
MTDDDTDSDTVTCGYCQTELHPDELHDHPDGKECPVCGTFAVGG